MSTEIDNPEMPSQPTANGVRIVPQDIVNAFTDEFFELLSGYKVRTESISIADKTRATEIFESVKTLRIDVGKVWDDDAFITAKLSTLKEVAKQYGSTAQSENGLRKAIIGKPKSVEPTYKLKNMAKRLSEVGITVEL